MPGLPIPKTPSRSWISNGSLPQSISRVTLKCSTVILNHAMETTQRGHPEDVMPFVIKHYRLTNGNGKTLAEIRDNHQTINVIEV